MVDVLHSAGFYRTVRQLLFCGLSMSQGLVVKWSYTQTAIAPGREKLLSKGFRFCRSIPRFGEYFKHHRQSVLVIDFEKENFASELFGSYKSLRLALEPRKP